MPGSPTGANPGAFGSPDILLPSMQLSAFNTFQEFRAALRALPQTLRDTDARPGEAPPNALLLPALILSYVAAMMIFSAFVRCWAPLHPDMTEMAAWGQQLQLSYSKHPPLAAWVAGAWFRVMPQTNWSFDLLAVLVAAIGLCGLWKTAGLYLDNRGQRIAMLPLMLTPALTTWAFKYNANSILLGLWPWTIYAFLRMLESGRLASGVLTGLLVGLSMLAKYYTVVLLATFLVVLLMHPRRNRVLASAAPYVAVLVALAVMAPHVWWILDQDTSPISYAIEKTHRDVADARLTTLRSVGAGLLTLLAPALLIGLAFRDDLAGVGARLKAGLGDGSRRWVLVLAWGPLAFTILAHLVSNVRIAGDFLIPAFLCVPLAFLVQSGPTVPAIAAERVTVGTAAVLGTIVVLSPVIGVATFLNASAFSLEPRAELASAATDFWHGSIRTPLRLVSGVERIASGISFYSPDHPVYLDGAKTFAFTRDDPRIVRDGLLFACPADDGNCLQNARHVLGEDGVQRFTFTGSHRVLGYAGPMQTFQLFLLAPRGLSP